jgi:hypothetical protein
LRLQEYHLFLLREVVIGENVCMELLQEVVRREVAAGRMLPRDELYDLALVGSNGSHYSHADLEAIAAPEAGEAKPALKGWRGLLHRLTKS